MNTSLVESALTRLGDVFEYHRDVEVLLVGGAAGMLTGLFPPTRHTFDCDVMVYAPPGVMVHIESAAETVAHEMGLPERWFNSDVQMRPDTLPDGYMRRRVFIGVYGMIRVFAVSRPDLIAMKVIAGRPQDLADLETLRIRSDEVEFVRDCIEGLHAKGTTPGQIQDAKEVLDSLQVFDDA